MIMIFTSAGLSISEQFVWGENQVDLGAQIPIWQLHLHEIQIRTGTFGGKAKFPLNLHSLSSSPMHHHHHHQCIIIIISPWCQQECQSLKWSGPEGKHVSRECNACSGDACRSGQNLGEIYCYRCTHWVLLIKASCGLSGHSQKGYDHCDQKMPFFGGFPHFFKLRMQNPLSLHSD